MTEKTNTFGAGPYILSNEAVIVLDASGYHTLKDLDGKNFAIQITTKPEQVLLNSEKSPNPQKVYCFLEIGDALGGRFNKVMLKRLRDTSILL